MQTHGPRSQFLDEISDVIYHMTDSEHLLPHADDGTIDARQAADGVFSSVYVTPECRARLIEDRILMPNGLNVTSWSTLNRLIRVHAYLDEATGQMTLNNYSRPPYR